MNDASQLSEYEFERLLTPETVRTFQIIQLTLMAGVTIFAAVVLFLYIKPASLGTPDFESLNTLSIAHAAFAVSMFIVSKVMYRKMFSGEIFSRSLSSAANPYQYSLLIMRTAMLIRMAMLEGSAFFGLAVVIIAVTGGAAKQEPAYFLNLLSTVLVVCVGAATFPTKERLKDTFLTYVKKTGL